MSISDGLDPSIFCRKLEKARLMREEMDGKVVYFPPESEFYIYFVVVIYQVLFLISTLNWRVKKFVFRQENV